MTQLFTILLVDDDPITNFLNEMLIQDIGTVQHVHTAENGAEALQQLSQTCGPASTNCPNLILLDMNMPVMNGIEFLEAYTRLPLAQTHGIVIVLLTTSLLPSDLERVKSLPVASVITKPLTKEKLQELIHDYFRQTPTG